MFLIAIPWIASAMSATAAAAATTAATTISVTEAAFIAGAAVGYIATKSKEEEK